MAVGNKKSSVASTKTVPSAVLIKLIFAFSILLLIASTVSWILLVRNKPENIFMGVLNNNYRTASVTRTVKQDNGYQQLEQIMRIQNRTQHVTNGVTKIQQGSASGTVIVTESVGLPNVEYIRYNSISTSQKGQNGQPLNFDDLLGIWGENKSPSDDQLSGLYQDVTLGSIFLFADFDQQTRSMMIDSIVNDKVYDVDYGSVDKYWESGRLKYKYEVSINPSAYIKMLKDYTAELGLNQLESINPEDYKDAKPIKSVVTIDVLSRRVDQVDMAGGSTIQMFNGYGIIENIEIPKETIPAEELQQRLTENASA